MTAARASAAAGDRPRPASGGSSRWVRWPEAALAFAAAAIILFWLPAGTLARLLRRHDAAAADGVADLREARLVASTIRRLACRLPGRPRCLAQAVAAHFMLRRRGIAHRVRFGVTKAAGAVRAHAWVTVRGVALLGGAEAPQFRPIAGFGRDGA